MPFDKNIALIPVFTCKLVSLECHYSFPSISGKQSMDLSHRICKPNYTLTDFSFATVEKDTWFRSCGLGQPPPPWVVVKTSSRETLIWGAHPSKCTDYWESKYSPSNQTTKGEQRLTLLYSGSIMYVCIKSKKLKKALFFDTTVTKYNAVLQLKPPKSAVIQIISSLNTCTFHRWGTCIFLLELNSWRHSFSSRLFPYYCWDKYTYQLHTRGSL